MHNNCFKGKAYKDVDWEHIFERHHIDGAIAKQRNRPDEIISGTQDEIKKKVLNSWKNRKKVHTQVLPEGEKRIKYRGSDNEGNTLEFWFNEATRIIETAYPG